VTWLRLSIERPNSFRAVSGLASRVAPSLMQKKFEPSCVLIVIAVSPEEISMNVLIRWLAVIELDMDDHLKV
jgi:hypothetical protein